MNDAAIYGAVLFMIGFAVGRFIGEIDARRKMQVERRRNEKQ